MAEDTDGSICSYRILKVYNKEVLGMAVKREYLYAIPLKRHKITLRFSNVN
ncbi:hypothetical protein CULT_2390005 [[Clostridium] ultunense Esp]|nr:hypothetical protein CULT_2390005 [[Clostridium] ultunense Esp]